MEQLHPSAARVQRALDEFGKGHKAITLPSSARTAQEAADSLGCEVGQIAKSLIFQTVDTKRSVLVIASGKNQVDTDKVAALLGEKIGRADAEFVRSTTGYAIGGIPPLGHENKSEIFIDEDLLTYETIWAAAGTPHAVFKLLPNELSEMTAGSVCCVKKNFR